MTSKYRKYRSHTLLSRWGKRGQSYRGTGSIARRHRLLMWLKAIVQRTGSRSRGFCLVFLHRGCRMTVPVQGSTQETQQ